jgi:PAS domain S-box-containing protein
MPHPETSPKSASLRQSESTFQRMLAHLPGMLYQFRLYADGAAAFPFVSEGCVELLELAPKQIEADASLFLRLIDDIDRPAFDRSLAASAQSLEAWHWEGWVTLPSGNRKCIKGEARPERQPDDSVMWDGYVSNVTRRKQAEESLKQSYEDLEQRVAERTVELAQSNWNLQNLLEERQRVDAALRENEARLQGLVDNIPFCFWVCDSDRRYVLQNARDIRQWGNCIGKRIDDTDLPPVEIQRWIGLYSRALAGEVVRTEHQFQEEGQTRICETVLAPIRNGDVIHGMLGVDVDITEQKLAEQALRQNEERLRLVLESIPVMMDAFDTAGNIIMWNSECERVTGYSAQEIIRNPKALEILYPNTAYRTRMMEQWARLGGNFRNWEWEIGCKDGSTKTIIWSNLSDEFPIPGWAGWGIGIDISDRKHAEEALRDSEHQLRDQAEELGRTLQELRRTQTQMVQNEKMSSLGQLVAGIAHEINNPVNFIYGNLNHARTYAESLLSLIQLYQNHYPTPVAEINTEIDEIDLDFVMEDLPKLLNSMRVGAERIQEIVRSLRNFSRMDESDRKSVNIHEGIDSTLLILQNRLKPRSDYPGIAITKEYADLPSIECYPGELNQVFMNILANAIDALEETTMEHPPTITIRTEQPASDRIRIAIADNGPGMTEAQRRRLFDPFYTTKPVGKGTGLGLSISYQVVVDRHGGQLSCISTPGQGAEFHIEIPISQCTQS